MHRYCCILVALVVATALGAEFESTRDTSREHSQELDEICLHNKYPSATCRFKCHSKNLKPYCDKARKKCLCKKSEEHEDEDDDDNIFDDLFSDIDDPPNKPDKKKHSFTDRQSEASKKKATEKKEKKKDSSDDDNHASRRKPAKKDDNDDNLFDDLFSDDDRNTLKKKATEKKGKKEDSSDENNHASKRKSAKKDDNDDNLFDDLFSDDDRNTLKKKATEKKGKKEDSSDENNHASKKKSAKKDDNDDNLFDDLFSDDDRNALKKKANENKGKEKDSSDESNQASKGKSANKDDNDDDLFYNWFSDDDKNALKKRATEKKEKKKDSSDESNHALKKKSPKKDESDDNLFDDLFSDDDSYPSKEKTAMKKEKKPDSSDTFSSDGGDDSSKKKSTKKGDDKDISFDDMILDGGTHKSDKKPPKDRYISKDESGKKKDDDESLWDDLFSDNDDAHSTKNNDDVKEHGKKSYVNETPSRKDHHHKSGNEKNKPDSWFNDVLSAFEHLPYPSNSPQKHNTEKYHTKQDDHLDTKLEKRKSKKNKDSDSLVNDLFSLFGEPLSGTSDKDNKKSKDSLPNETHSGKDKNQPISLKKLGNTIVNDLFSIFDNPDDSNKKSDTKKEDVKPSSAEKPTKVKNNKQNKDDDNSWDSDLISAFDDLFDEKPTPKKNYDKFSQEDAVSDQGKQSLKHKLPKKTDDSSSIANEPFANFDRPPKSMHEKKGSGKSTSNTSTESSGSLGDMCLTDKNPSMSCKFKCHDQNLEAYCDEKHNKCRCGPPSGKAMIQNIFNDLFSNDDVTKKTGSSTTSPKKHLENSLSKQSESVQQESDRCISDKYPSTACTSKCDMMQMQAYCDKDMRQCLCRLSLDKNKSDSIFNDFLSGGDNHVSTTPSPLMPLALPTSTTVQPLQDLGELCFFGNTPSATCRFKCKSVNMEPYCDKDLKKCLCRENSKKTDLMDFTSDESGHKSPDHAMASDAIKLDKPLGEICFYDKYPSATCRYNCHLKNMQPYCDASTHECLCKPFQSLHDQPPASVLPNLLPPLPFFNFGAPFTPSAPTLGNNDVCYFDKIPSSACLRKCQDINQLARCDEFLHKCVCRVDDKNHDGLLNLASDILGNSNVQSTFDSFKPLESPINRPLGEEDVHVVPSHPEPEEHKPLHIFYFFNPFKMFGPSDHNEPEDKGIATSTPSTEVPPIITKILHEEMVRPHWSFQHTMAVVIIGLLAVLIFLELYACHKRRVGKNSMDTMFSTVPGKA